VTRTPLGTLPEPSAAYLPREAGVRDDFETDVAEWDRRGAYRVLAVDVDGTLAGADGQVTSRTIAALSRVEAAGIRVVLVTGRALPATFDIWTLAHLSAPLIACGGALIVQPGTREVVWSHSVSRWVASRCISLGLELGVQVSMWTEDAIWVSDLGLVAQELGRLNQMQVRLLAPGPGAPVPLGPTPVLKVMFGGAPALLDQVQDRIVSELGGAYVARGLPEFIDVDPLGSSKRDALETVLLRLGVSSGDMIAIGDGDNDAGMLDMAGFAVVPANAMARARAVADLVIGHHDHEGVAEFLEEIVMSWHTG
jgi:Cof subfamily protein (haloacid dehalogenase superfamily)